MLGITKQLINFLPYNTVSTKAFVRKYQGGVPGCNLPFKLDKPYRFMAFYLLAGVVGFGSPWLVVMHQMLRPYDYE